MGVQHHPVSARPGPAWPEMWRSGGGAGWAGRAGSLILMGSAHGIRVRVIHITRWQHSGDCAPNEVPDPVSVAWAPRSGHRHHYHGNRVLGALGPPPHCLTPLVPPPFSSVRGQISDRLGLPLPDTTCRIHSIKKSHVFGSRTEESYFLEVLLPASCCPVVCRGLASRGSGKEEPPRN